MSIITAVGDKTNPNQLLSDEDAVIHLPPSLFKTLGDVGIYFGLYETQALFPISGVASNDRRHPQIFTRIIAATVGQNLNISNLSEPVTITFRPQIIEGMVCFPSLHCLRTARK